MFAPNEFQADGNNPGDNGPSMSSDQVEDYDSMDSDDSDGDDKKRKRPRNQQRHMTEEQRVERRCGACVFTISLSFLPPLIGNL